MLLRIGTLNVRGLRNELKRTTIASDIEKYKLDILLIQETHIKNTEIFEIKSNKNSKYIVYNSGGGSFRGVGIITRSDLECSFIPVNDRICYIICTINKNKYFFFSTMHQLYLRVKKILKLGK